mmetsp:Transcript_38118/g.75356  ORF Transcript_38118/g.75356 Transcript_38118/m.75356 type:complete len:221 (-) Transcript_38118:275-937(-)
MVTTKNGRAIRDSAAAAASDCAAASATALSSLELCCCFGRRAAAALAAAAAAGEARSSSKETGGAAAAAATVAAEASRAALRLTRLWKVTFCARSCRRCSFLRSTLCSRLAFSRSSASRPCAAFVGSPRQLISFLSFETISMAMSTLRASYTRRRMFFSSYPALPVGTSGLFVPRETNSATSSSATSLYVVRPFSSTFRHTFMLKCRSPFPCFESRSSCC